MSEDKKLVFEGYLYNSASDRLIIQNEKGESVEIDDTLMRSRFLCSGVLVRLTVEEIDEQ